MEDEIGRVKDILLFRKLITPYVLQILFWGGIGGTFYGAYWLFVHDNWAWWMALVFGTLLTRLIFESAMVRFRTYERLNQIGAKLDDIARSNTPLQSQPDE